MSCQDDLSQLMPTLYSKVGLAVHPDSTANLLQYAKDYQLMGSPSSAPASSLIPPTGVQQQQQLGQEHQQNQAALQQYTQRQQDRTQMQGTGRVIAHRSFNLELR